FDVTRDPNPHVGFGGGGAHFCLGANLARREIAVAFEELHRRIPDIVATEEPARLLSSFIHGIKQLPVAWTPPGLARWLFSPEASCRVAAPPASASRSSRHWTRPSAALADPLARCWRRARAARLWCS